MKNLFVALALLLLVVGCAKAPVVDTAAPAKTGELPPSAAPTAEENAAVERVVVPAVEEEVAPPPVVAKNTPDVEAVLERSREKVTSYEFYLAPPPDNLARDKYKVKGTKVKVELYEVNAYNPEEYFDTLYLDYAKRTAWSYCLRKDSIQCSGVRDGKQVPFDKVAIKLPMQYLAEIAGAKKIGSETLYDRQTVKLSYEVNGEPYTTWVDQYSGLPVRVVIGDARDAPKWEFRELAINALFDEDVTAPVN